MASPRCPPPSYQGETSRKKGLASLLSNGRKPTSSMMRSAELRNGQRHRVLEVWKAGYYAWRARPLSDREQRQSAHAHGTHRAGHHVRQASRRAAHA